MSDDETTRRHPAPPGRADEDTVRYPATLRPEPVAARPELAPAGLRSAPPPVPPAREDDTLRGIPVTQAAPSAGATPPPPGPVPRATFTGAASSPAPTDAGSPAAKSPFKRTLVAASGLAKPAAPPSEPLREPPPSRPGSSEDEPLREIPGPVPPARTLSMGGLAPPPAPAPGGSPFHQTPSARPGAASPDPALEATLSRPASTARPPAPRAETPRPPAATPQQPPPGAQTPPRPALRPGARHEVPIGKRSGTRPKTSAPPPPSPHTSPPPPAPPQAGPRPPAPAEQPAPQGRPDEQGHAAALRLDDDDRIELPTGRLPGVGGGRRTAMLAVAALAAIGVVGGLWLSGSRRGAEPAAATPPDAPAVAPAAPAPPSQEAQAPQQAEARAPRQAATDPGAENGKRAAEEAEAPAAKKRATAQRRRAKRRAARARERQAARARRRRAPQAPAAPVARSAEDEANIEGARSILRQLESEPVIQIKPTTSTTADRALQEAMGRQPSPAPQPEPAPPPRAAPPAPASDPPVPVLQLKPAQ